MTAQRREAMGRSDVLVALLAFSSGGLDVVTLMAIGGAFTSVVTGNLIFIGRAIGTSSLSPALHAVMAVIGYMFGVAVGSRLAHEIASRQPRRTTNWPRSATVVVALEAIVLSVLNLVWVLDCARPGGRTVDCLLIAAAFALGLQSAAARSVPGVPPTTYMTGALTTLIESVATGRHRAIDRSAGCGLLALVAGAGCGALLVLHAERVALVPPLIALLTVVAAGCRADAVAEPDEDPPAHVAS